MKGKVLRIAIAVAALAALAAIPASTQVAQTSSQAASSQSSGNLPLILLVNRLELSRSQMETVRTTIENLLAQGNVLSQKEASFESDMIAFNGTAEELDTRLAAFSADMKAAREDFRKQAAAAVDTLEETLTMKQGKILIEAFPGLMARLDALSSSATAAASQAMAPSAVVVATNQPGAMMVQRGQVAGMAMPGQAAAQTTASSTQNPGTMAAGSSGCVMMQSGSMGMMQGGQTPAAPTTQTMPSAPTSTTQSAAAGQTGCAMMQGGPMSATQSGQAQASQASQDATSVASKIQAMADRLRERLANRVGASSATSTASQTAAPAAAAATPAPAATAACPMMGAAGASSRAATVSAQAGQAVAEGAAADFGTLTVSLSSDDSSSVATPLGLGPRVIDWLERLAHVLEMKLAAMP